MGKYTRSIDSIRASLLNTHSVSIVGTFLKTNDLQQELNVHPLQRLLEILAQLGAISENITTKFMENFK